MNLDRDIAISVFKFLLIYNYIYNYFNIIAIEISQENTMTFEML